MSEDLQAVNARLKELSKEFQDMSALKKKLLAQTKFDTLKDKFGEYKFLVKKKENTPLDFDKLLNESDLDFAKSTYGLTLAVYNVGERQVHYHVAKTEEEANEIRLVEGLFKVGDTITDKVKANNPLTAKEILELYDGARSGQQLSETETEEEVTE